MRAILSIFIISAGAAAADDFDSLIKQGREAFLAYDLDAAQDAYAKACPAERVPAFPLQKAALCEHSSGTVAEARQRGDEAATHYLKALSALEKLGPPSLALTAATLTNLGTLYRREHRTADAEKMLTQALELSRTVAGTNPDLYAIALSRSGALYGDLDQPDRARQMLDEAVAAFRALSRPDAPELADAYNSRGMLDIGSGRYKSAESSFREAMTLAAGSLGETNPATAAYATNLAMSLLMEGQYSRAETLLRRARFVVESRLGPDDMQMVNVLAGLTSVETALGRFRMAEDCGEKALSILNSRVPDGGLQTVLMQIELGTLFLREHNTAEAAKILPAAVAAERRLLRNERILGDGIRDLAELRAQQHAWNDAESLYREAICVYERTLGEGHPDIAPVLRAYADVLKHQGVRSAHVKSIEARARAIEKMRGRSQVS